MQALFPALPAFHHGVLTIQVTFKVQQLQALFVEGESCELRFFGVCVHDHSPVGLPSVHGGSTQHSPYVGLPLNRLYLTTMRSLLGLNRAFVEQDDQLVIVTPHGVF